MSLPRGGREYPRTWLEFEDFFPDEESCHQYLAALRWPDGFVCSVCQWTGHPWLVRRHLYRCRHCRRECSVTTGTLFQRTHLPLRIWFLAAWEMTSTKHGTTAVDVQRQLGLGSYTTAWLLCHKLRRAMVRSGRDQLSGTVEADEIYLGSLEPGRRGGWSSLTKAIIVVVVETKRDHLGRVRLKHVPDLTARSLAGFVREVVVPGSHVHTDKLQSYASLKRDYRHEATAVTTLPESAETALPGVNRIAALLKRWLLGVVQGGLAREHLQTYLEEFSFRFNRRSSSARGLLFRRLLEQVVVTEPLPWEKLAQGTGRGRNRPGGVK
jgi:transposase-like protein